MFEIFVEGDFSAAHNLVNYKGKCEQLHGHNYKVRIYVYGKKPAEDGILVDFTDLKKELKKVISKLDHKYLNEIEPFNKVNPTAENIAKYIFKQLQVISCKLKISKVSVWETERNCATYYEE
ncbi:MAG: 6-carboxytetrahydropterin synthase QueD [Elusimicrobia bacterium]|nr:6-carboxytetrahydropterin synthase QueD [Elusimicrobiota bacterium]